MQARGLGAADVVAAKINTTVLLSRGGICKLKKKKKKIDNDNLMDVYEDSDEDTDESSYELVDNDPYINDTESDDDDN